MIEETSSSFQKMHLNIDGEGDIGARIYSRMQHDAFHKNRILFGQFPIMETRLRQLRLYMDSQKPRGIRQLWADNRDSLNYYTL